MGKWLKKVGRKVQKLANKVGDKVMDEVGDQVTSLVGQVDWGDTLQTVQAKGQECVHASSETIAICDATQEKREQMIAFASEIQSTLSNFSSGKNDASVLETIRDLTDGEKVRHAMELAKGLDEAALACVEKSTIMIEAMEQGVDSLPDVVQKALEAATGDAGGDDDDDEEEELLKGLENDMEDIRACVKSIKDLNLSTALKVGLDAFNQLSDKATRSKSLFLSVRGFAADVQEVSQSFTDMDVSTIASKSKDMLRCIGMCETMKQIAQGAGKLLQLLISLFQATADRVSELWAALAFTKDCMTESFELVEQAKVYCLEARDKSKTLVTKSRDIQGQLESVRDLNRHSFSAVRNLAKGGEIQEAIALARNMDDVIVECTGKVTTMIDRVSEGFQSIPPILTDGLDFQQAGRHEDDPEPLDVEKDVQELEEARSAIEGSDIFGVVQAGKRGFGGVSEKSQVCEETLTLVEKFSGDCSNVIESFLSVWDLESVTTKIKEMCRLVNLGEIMKQFSEQVKRLLLSIIALMKAAVTKFSQDFPNIAEGVSDAVNVAKDKVEDAVDDMKEKVDKLKFWKK